MSIAVYVGDMTGLPLLVQWGEPSGEGEGGEVVPQSRQGAGALALGLLSSLIDKLGMLWDQVSSKLDTQVLCSQQPLYNR